MFRFGRALWHRLSSRPRLTAFVTVLLLVALTAAGTYGWGAYQFRAAERAIQVEDYPLARSHIQSCLRVWPWSADAHFLAARIARLNWDFPAAETSLHECRRLKHGVNEEIQLEWILLRVQRGDRDRELLEGLHLCLDQHDPHSPLILETLAMVTTNRGEFQPALHYLNLWLELEPDSAKVLDWRAWVNEQLGYWEQKALPDYERSLELAPERVKTRIRLCNLYLSQRYLDRVLPHLEYLCRHHPEVPEGFIGLGRYWLDNNDLPQARTQLDRALKLQPSNGEALLWRGQVELRADQPAEAEAWLRKAREQLPHDPQVAEALARSLQKQPDRVEEAAVAVRQFEDLRADVKHLKHLLLIEVDQDPTNPAVPCKVGKLFFRLGQDALALQWLSTALVRDPLCEPAHRLLLEHFEKTDQPERAQPHREALERIKAKAQAPKPR